MTLFRYCAAATVLLGTSTVLAGPVSAEALEGPYTRTITAKSGGPIHVGGQTPWVLSPCGATCLHIHQAVDPEWDIDLHLEGNRWAGAIAERRTTSFDKDTLLGQDTYSMSAGVFTADYTLTKG